VPAAFFPTLDILLPHAKIKSAPAYQGGILSRLRVISGKLKGKRLFTLKGMDLRPTSDRVKEAIFDILQNSIPGQKVLDLFAGTGAMGIEALSRGAKRALFVEGSRRSLAVLYKNLEACRLQEQAEVLSREVEAGIKILSERGETFDLIFLDPPYGKGLAREALQALSGRSILTSAEALIVAEHSPAENLEDIPSLERIDQRRYGSTLVSFFRESSAVLQCGSAPVP
jgi:16S rRNA (guanine966-N2)-methyltransferase